MQNEQISFRKYVIISSKKYEIEYIILKTGNDYGVKIKSTASANIESKTIFPIEMSKDEIFHFLGTLSKNLVFPISLNDIYEDITYDKLQML
jgi:hypothetical protein